MSRDKKSREIEVATDENIEESNPNDVVETIGNKKVVVPKGKQPGRPEPNVIREMKKISSVTQEKETFRNSKGMRVTKVYEISRSGRAVSRRLIGTTKTK